MSSRDLIGAETSGTNSASAASSPSLHRTRRIGHSFLRDSRRVHNTLLRPYHPAQDFCTRKRLQKKIPIQMITLIAVSRFTAVEAKEVLNLFMGQYGHTACSGRQAGRWLPHLRNRSKESPLPACCFLRREGGDDFFEARFAAQGIPERH